MRVARNGGAAIFDEIGPSHGAAVSRLELASAPARHKRRIHAAHTARLPPDSVIQIIEVQRLQSLGCVVQCFGMFHSYGKLGGVWPYSIGCSMCRPPAA